MSAQKKSTRIISEKPKEKSWISYANEVREIGSLINKKRVGDFFDFIYEAYANQERLYVAGNGGLYAMASHLVIDFTKGAGHRSGRRLNVEQLGANGSVVTAWANDLRYEEIYAEELKTRQQYSSSKFRFLALSCSGNSKNILGAIDYCNSNHQSKTFAVVCFDGGFLKHRASNFLHIPTWDYGIGEDCIHMLVHWTTNRLREKIKEA